MTGAQRKAFAAEVGRLILNLQENSKEDSNSNLEIQWIFELVNKTGISLQTAYNWWSSFCKDAGLSITPKQATAENKTAFFDWLVEQKRKADEEKAAKEAEAEAEKQAKAETAKLKRQERELSDLGDALDKMAEEFGVQVMADYLLRWIELASLKDGPKK